MKKILLGAIVCLSAIQFQTASAQVRLNVNVNIGSQPRWGPAGYDYVEYYYLPEIETYYYVPTRQFVYLSAGNWVFSHSLPYRYRSYNLYNGYKVVVNEPRAYHNFYRHRASYAGYRGRPSQVIVRDNYYKGSNRGHGKYKKQKHGRGRH